LSENRDMAGVMYFTSRLCSAVKGTLRSGLTIRCFGGKMWTGPFGGGVGRIMKLGFQPVNLTAQFCGNAVYPNGASPWNMRLRIASLFLKLTPAQEKMMMEQKLKQLDQPPPAKN
jgi:hypothetical protein